MNECISDIFLEGHASTLLSHLLNQVIWITLVRSFELFVMNIQWRAHSKYSREHNRARPSVLQSVFATRSLLGGMFCCWWFSTSLTDWLMNVADPSSAFGRYQFTSSCTPFCVVYSSSSNSNGSPLGLVVVWSVVLIVANPVHHHHYPDTFCFVFLCTSVSASTCSWRGRILWQWSSGMHPFTGPTIITPILIDLITL